MRPVSYEFEDSQQFGEGATGGVPANPNPNSGMGYYVYLYGNYQPYGHAGKDIACPIGTPVHAMADGTVLWAGWVEDLPGDDSAAGYAQRWDLYKYFGGICTVIQHSWGKGVYAHQSTNDAVTVGQWVTEGQVIGASGNTKTRTTTVAPHLHVEALVDDNYGTGNGLIYGRTDPTPYFGGIAAQGTITPVQEDDMAQVSQDDWNAALAILRSLDANVATKAHVQPIIDSVVPPPGGITPAIASAWSDYNRDLILTAVKARPAGTPGAVDVDALVARLKAELPAAVLAELTAKLTKP